ncbi:N-acetyl-gamma-glutamyl-phosphate reductase [Niastella yeongjuensis]|uniref:N-acetyl-gamma-glutamyl-phosphate reductase n=1 Tax=Niastella yeongjuensis TaxID=354355 RepID=A0A1V9ELQ3_9BACT|nr:N-acetyl-gamma-glutamyl-phosphate reductase [Niastella yeongjuensis]OQP47078.1 N-acetyl-gamma-glutamyl-phosphate reductase [Niastella yeongjuensis]SEN68809.1 N-acetyl-gamma-glutamyl-phosphate reductase [Niastella yeongjuensis]
MSKKVRVGIIGGAGYTGGELLRLLVNHPQVEIAFINSKSNAGNPISQVHADLIGETDLLFSDDLSPLQDGSVDVIFLCVGHGDARKFLSEYTVNDKIKIIDLSQDFRLAPKSSIGNRQFVYGLPELNKDQIKSAQNIANPGCFATGIQLGLLPLAKAGLLGPVYTTGITGSTGAGQGLSATSHFSWRANNIQAYKTLTHQHLKEITQSIQQLQPGFSPVTAEGSSESLSFIPWRGDFTRGIFISSLVDCDWKLEQLIELYSDFYKGQPFTVLSKSEIFLKQVVNTNKCVIQLEKIGSKLVVHSAIDNLTKGASGQAVQNMNLIFGLEETAGLKLKANYF